MFRSNAFRAFSAPLSSSRRTRAFASITASDWGALREVLGRPGANGPSRGASTIPMQTAKNLFLWPSRSYIRKAIEIPLALLIDLEWPKRRILEVYLNLAEWGKGVFGAEAAARHYFHKGADRLDAREAALLATALPSPGHRNAARPSPRHAGLATRVMGRGRGRPVRSSNALNKVRNDPSDNRFRIAAAASILGWSSIGFLCKRHVIPSPAVIDSDVMPGLEPGIQALAFGVWMAGSSPAMTTGEPMGHPLRDDPQARDAVPPARTDIETATWPFRNAKPPR